MSRVLRIFAVAAFILVGPAEGGRHILSAQVPTVLRWAGDPEGGAPFVEADPSRPDEVVGFDVEIASLFARSLGRRPEFINITFTTIDQSIARGDAEIGFHIDERTEELIPDEEVYKAGWVFAIPTASETLRPIGAAYTWTVAVDCSVTLVPSITVGLAAEVPMWMCVVARV